MEQWLHPIYSNFFLQLAFGALLAGNIILFVRIRALRLLREEWIELVGLTYYEQSGFWVGIFTGFVAAFLPAFLLVCCSFTFAVILLNTFLVGRMENLIARSRQRDYGNYHL